MHTTPQPPNTQYVFTDPDSGQVLPTPGSTILPGTFVSGAQAVDVGLGAELALSRDVGVSLELQVCAEGRRCYCK